jgi:hypothetical protein
MVQRFSELQRIDQGLAGSILFVQPVQAFTGNQKHSDSLAIIPEPDPAQFSTPTQKKRSSKYVRGLKAVGFQVAHLLSELIFWGRCVRKRKPF